MGQVRLILSEDVEALGEAGELVSVKPGYARNFLLPEGKALLATGERVKQLEHEKRVVAARLAKERKDLEALKKRLEATKLEFRAQAGEEGKLFGSITAAQIAEQLAEKGLEVDRRKIALGEPIKTLGKHAVAFKLRGDLVAELDVSVEAEE